MEDFLNTVRNFVSGGKKPLSPLPSGYDKPRQYPGQEDYALSRFNQGADPDEARRKYTQAVESPGFSGQYYQPLRGETPTPTPGLQAVLGQAIKTLTGNQQAEAAPIPSPTLAPNANDFEKRALPILNQYEIPPSIGFGMKDAEGGKIGANNAYNIEAYDANPAKAKNYASVEDAVRAYAELLSKDPRYQQAYADRADKDKMLKEIVQAGYAGDPATWKQRSAKAGGAGKIYDTYDEFVRATNGYNRYKN